MRDFRNNSCFIIIGYFTGFFQVAITTAIQLISGKKYPLKKPSFSLIHFLLQSGPKAFQEFPTGIRAGRSIATFLLLLFTKNETPTSSKK